jgi:acyl-CoA dehydrogenase
MSQPKQTLNLSAVTQLPFFDDIHRQLAGDLAQWMHVQHVDETDDRAACKQWVKLLGQSGWLQWCVPSAYGGTLAQIDSRALVLIRETLAYYSPLADFAFAMQGLGSGAISLGATSPVAQQYLPAVARGDKIAAFALSEPQAGSDVAALQTSATGAADGFVLSGEKTWISNGDMADFYCVFARDHSLGQVISQGSQGLSCFVVDAPTAGLDSSQHIQVIAPHPLSTLVFNQCHVPLTARIGTAGSGFKLAMQVLDIFRPSVAGAALGMARRALYEATDYACQRPMFGTHLSQLQLTQAKLGEMAAKLDAGALLTYRTAWLRDVKGVRTTTEAAMAKLTATENAQQIIDAALQLHGGNGVRVGFKVEALYRDIRALRIYEGASEVQQLIIGKAQISNAR